jgi:hypothetical protein
MPLVCNPGTRGGVSFKIAHYSLCTKSLVVTSECLGMAQRSGQPYFFESEGFDSPWLPSFCTLNSSRGTMPHHRANPLVPHLLTVRVTFIYIACHIYCNKYIGRSQNHQYNNNIIVRIPVLFTIQYIVVPKYCNTIYSRRKILQ